MGPHRKEWTDLKPDRPKRPASGFANFVSELSKRPRIENAPHVSGREIIQQAAAVWNAFDQAGRVRYLPNHEALAGYTQRMEQFKATISAMKGPPPAYALYLQHFWAINNPQIPAGVSKEERQEAFQHIQRDISQAWNALSEEERAVYHSSADLLKTLFEREQARVLGGQGLADLNLNWRAEGLAEVMQRLQRQPRAAQNRQQEAPARIIEIVDLKDEDFHGDVEEE